MAKYKRQKVKHYHRSFYSREMRVKRGIGIAVLVVAVLAAAWFAAPHVLDWATHTWYTVVKDRDLEAESASRAEAAASSAAASSAAASQAASEPEPEEEKAEQPELPRLKNNDQRAAFVDDYESWPLWIDNQETGEKYYRYDLPDGTSFVVKVYHAMIFLGWEVESGSRYEEGYGLSEQYILKPGKFFRDCRTIRSAMIENLKELQKSE